MKFCWKQWRSNSSQVFDQEVKHLARRFLECHWPHPQGLQIEQITELSGLCWFLLGCSGPAFLPLSPVAFYASKGSESNL